MVLLKLSYKKKLYRPISLRLDNSFCYINDFFLTLNLKLKRIKFLE